MDISQLGHPAASSSGPNSQRSGGLVDARGSAADISQLGRQSAPSSVAASSAPHSERSGRQRSEALQQPTAAAAGAAGSAPASQRSGESDSGAAGLPATGSRRGSSAGDLLPPEPAFPGATQLPSTSALWRVDNLADSGDFSFTAPPYAQGHVQAMGPLPPTSTVPRTHDAVPRHHAPHAWDLASLGQEPPPPAPSEAWPAAAGLNPAVEAAPLGRAQPPMAGLAPVGGGARGFGGARGPIAPGAEAQLVDRLAQRFVLDRRTPSLEKRERNAYQEMLQQVAWTALEPTAAQEASLLLSKRWLAPVSSAETLRAFRRCLHTILCDERVLDIVELQMASHFGRRATGVAGGGPPG